MFEAITSILTIIGLLGIVLFILAAVNIATGTLTNIWNGNEDFSKKKLFRGIGKVILFYVGAACISVAFTMLPFINDMIANSFGTMIVSNDTLNTLSSVGVLGVITTSIVAQGKKALEGLMKISNISTNAEEITWEVIEEEGDE